VTRYLFECINATGTRIFVIQATSPPAALEVFDNRHGIEWQWRRVFVGNRCLWRCD
jgi:hypothetical protein